MDKQVVIARYKEDVGWVDQLDCDYIIYDKSGDVIDNIPNRVCLKNQPKGREAHTYLYHIVNHYNNLADCTCFLQGHPFDHCIDILDIIKNPPAIHFTPLGKIRIVKIYDMELQYISGAQFIATKQCIQSLPLLFYQKSLELTYTNLFSGTHFEFMWLYIMGHNKYICKETMKYIKENNLVNENTGWDNTIVRKKDFICLK